MKAILLTVNGTVKVKELTGKVTHTKAILSMEKKPAKANIHGLTTVNMKGIF